MVIQLSQVRGNGYPVPPPPKHLFQRVVLAYRSNCTLCNLHFTLQSVYFTFSAPCVLPKADCLILFTAPTVANSSSTMYTCTLPAMHRISFSAENLSQFCLLTHRLPPQWCCHHQQSSQMLLRAVCRASFSPCLPLSVDFGLKKVPSNPLATSGQQWSTSGQPMGNQWVLNE